MNLSNTKAAHVLDQVTISAPSRLHFGLFSVGDIVQRKFGGIGLMIDQPRTVITATRSSEFAVSGPSCEDVKLALGIWFEKLQPELAKSFSIKLAHQLPVNLEINSLPPRHSGFGSGTQLALASATAVAKLLKLPPQSADELAATLDRGKRSAIGTHGFCCGGFLVDRGKLENEILAPLDFQSNFPELWSVVLVRLKDFQGVSGEQEIEAFKHIPSTNEKQREEMIDLVRSQITPGVIQQDYDLFADAIYEFGRRSGMMFAAVQGGAYQSKSVGALVHQIRNFGVNAVGQSSWGPCVFAITRNHEQAKKLTKFLQKEHASKIDVMITKADNSGGTCSVTPTPLEIGNSPCHLSE